MRIVLLSQVTRTVRITKQRNPLLTGSQKYDPVCNYHKCLALNPFNPQLNFTRNTGFFNRLTGEQLWGSVSGVSGAGKKKGRGKRVGRKKNIDLNKGQIHGTGEANIVWPGLNAPLLQGSQLTKQQQLPPNPDYKADIIKKREEMVKFVIQASPPLIRGWSGKRLGGTSIGQPDPIGDFKFEGFDARVLEYKVVSNMTGTLGRKRTVSAFVAVGNGNGVAGFALGKAQNGRTALKVAKNRAAQHLMYIPRFEDQTVYHNIYTQFHKSKIFVHRKEKGYGLVCHRLIATLCKLIGIKDLHCKVEGSSKNKQTVTKAFFQALTQQETHQEMADRLKLHVVEFRPERDNLPIVVASPQNGDVSDKPYMVEEEDLDGSYNRMHFGGKVEYFGKYQKPPPHTHLTSWRYKRARLHENRNQQQAQIMRRAGFW